MKCPLMFMSWQATPKKMKFEPMDCYKEECAWWNKAKGCCGERTKRKQLERIAYILKDLADKMPHEEQFRR